MVEGSTRKIYRQKGTGRARHGNIRAPIFVGGGITFGPVPHDFSMKMPEKMRRLALACALTSQYESGNVVFVDGLASLKPKTKYMAQSLTSLIGDARTLLVVGKEKGLVTRTARNIHNITLTSAESLNTYDVLSHNKIVFMKDGVAVVKEIITKTE
jgi:large subunit ribosomal protein L4